jgi:hypothetical protein
MSTEGKETPTPEPAYKVALGDDGNLDFKVLVGPRNFNCELTDPEDALWCRDLQPAWDRLNELETESADLRRKLVRVETDLNAAREVIKRSCAGRNGR